MSVQVPLLLILQLYHNTRLCRSIFAKKEHQTQITAQQVSVIDLNALWPPPIIQHRRKKKKATSIFLGQLDFRRTVPFSLCFCRFLPSAWTLTLTLLHCLSVCFVFLLGVTIVVWTPPHTQTPCLPSLALGASVSVYKTTQNPSQSRAVAVFTPRLPVSGYCNTANGANYCQHCAAIHLFS